MPTGFLLWLLDAALGAGCMMVAFYTSPRVGLGEFRGQHGHVSMEIACSLMAFSTAVVRHLAGVQRRFQGGWRLLLALRSMAISWCSIALTIALCYGLFYKHIGRYIALELAIILPFAFAASRLALWYLTPDPKRRILLLGYESSRRLVEGLVVSTSAEFDLVARTGCFAEGRSCSEEISRNIDDAGCDLLSGFLTTRCHEIVDGIGLHHRPGCSEALLRCIANGVTVSTLGGFVERNFRLVPISEIGPDWFVHASIDAAPPIQQAIKRTLDALAAVAGIAVLAPVMVLAGIAIRLESRGPAMYSQIRSGMFGRPFRIWKLRSMYVDAEKSGPQWAQRGDSRVTYVGRVLRLTRLDEVPQLWNILLGEMSLVGPRPERPEFVNELARSIPFYEMRLLVKPGLTGWAQVNYPYGSTVEDARNKLSYDLYYLKHKSFSLDMQIILRTLVVAARGAR